MPLSHIVLVDPTRVERRRSSLADLQSYKDRSRSHRDLRYVPSSELSGYTSQYTEPRYRSQYALHTDSHRDQYQSHPSVNSNFSTSFPSGVNSNFPSSVNTNFYPDGGDIASYSRPFGIRNTNIDITTKSFNSRLFDRKSPDTDRPILELGTDFRRRFHSDRSHDLAASGYSRDSGGEVASTAPTRSKSLKEHERHKETSEDHLLLPVQRPRINSGDSVGSQSSERSDKGDNSKALFKAYQNRYKEHAEKHAEESTARQPFSSWRRSGNFENSDKNVESKSDDHKRSNIDRKGRVFISAEDHSQHGQEKKDKKHDTVKKSEKKEMEKDVLSPKQEEGDKGDELMLNFRQALRRHQISEERKASEERDSSKDDMIEKIRAAKAQIKQLKESKIKSEDSAEKTSLHDSQKLLSSSSVEESSDNKSVMKTAPKLARQRLVSDELKAKYIESKKEDKDDMVRPKEIEHDRKKHTRFKQTEHKDLQTFENSEMKTNEPEKSKEVTNRKDFRKAIAEKFKKESSGFEFGTSFTAKQKAVEAKDDKKQVTSDKTVDNKEPLEMPDRTASPLTSVYKFEPKVDNKTKESDGNFLNKPVKNKEPLEMSDRTATSLTSVYKFEPKVDNKTKESDGNFLNKPVKNKEPLEMSDRTATSLTSVYKFEPKVDNKTKESDENFLNKPVSSLMYQEPTSTQVLGYKSSKDTDQNEIVESRFRDSDRKQRRQMKKHTKAKSVELGLLSKSKEEKIESHAVQDDSAIIPKLTTDETSRKERIDKYKEERKKQLATMFEGGESEMPSLFLASRPETETSVLSRSRSLKVESDSKLDTAIGPVRSKSMKEASPVHVSKISGLQLAEIGSQSKDLYEKHGEETSKQVPKVAKTKDQKEIKGITHRTMLADMVLAEDREQASRSSFEKETDSGHESADSTKRIRRRLPSLEDVLGTNIAENESYEKKPEIKQYTELKKPKGSEPVKPSMEFSLDYSKVKITPKSIPVEMSQGRVISKRYDVVQPQEEVYNGYHGSESKGFQTYGGTSDVGQSPVKSSFKEEDMIVDQKNKSSELLDSEIQIDSVSKRSKYFMQSEDRPNTMLFASDYRKPKTEPEIKQVHEPLRQYPSEKISYLYDDSVVNEKEIPVTEKTGVSGDINKESERSRSSTPERMMSVSEAKKLFSESSKQQIFGTDYVHKTKEQETIASAKYTTPVLEKDSESDFKNNENEEAQQILLGLQSSLAEISDMVSERIHSSQTQQKSRQHKIPTREEAIGVSAAKPPLSPRTEIGVSAAKPPLSPRTERKRMGDTKFGKVSYRSSESDESKFDVMKDNETSKFRELGREKQIQKPATVKERSPSVESIPKADIRMKQTGKERSPSVESIPKTGVTKISYRDLEKARHEKFAKFQTDSNAPQELFVFGSDFRKPVPKPDNLSHADIQIKSKSEANTAETSQTNQPLSDYDRHKTEIDTKDKHDKVPTMKDSKQFKKDSDHKSHSDAIMFGSDFRKIKTEVKPSEEDLKSKNYLLKEQAQIKESDFSVQPTVHKTDMLETHKKKEAVVMSVQTKSTAEVDKYPVSKPADAKVDIKAEAVSAASGHIIEVPVSPRQKLPPKIVSMSKQEIVPKMEVKQEIKLISKPKVENIKPETPAQISGEIKISEPSMLEKSKKQVLDSKPSHVEPVIPKTETMRPLETNDKKKPVQYVHPSPLLTFSAKTELPKKMEIAETKLSAQVEKKAQVAPENKKEVAPSAETVEKVDNVRESDRQFINKRAKEEEWKKFVDTESEFHKKTVEKMLLDTSLDDILSRNVDYLSDSEKTPGGSGRGRAEKKPRPQSVHEESRSHGRTKRIFKKKNLQRSKSEDRSHFKVDDSGTVQRSKDTEDIGRSRKQGGAGRDTREETEQQKKSKKMEWSINRVTKMLHLKE